MTSLASVGRLNGFCGSCKREVVVSEQTLACPTCGRQVDPLSPPSVPRAERTEPAALPVPAKTVEPSQQQQTVTLPSIREAGTWSRATDTLLAALEREEAAADAALESARKRAREAKRAASALRQLRGLVRCDSASSEALPSSALLKSGRWSRRCGACLECGTTTIAHAGKGLCRTCVKRHQRSVQ